MQPIGLTFTLSSGYARLDAMRMHARTSTRAHTHTTTKTHSRARAHTQVIPRLLAVLAIECVLLL